MKGFLLFAALGGAAFAAAQDDQTGSPAGSTSGLRMSNMAIMKAVGALKGGKKVTLTVDNRSVAFEPRLIRNMVYVPVRFFNETGQEVAWSGTDMRATLTNTNGRTKNTLTYDAMTASRGNKPGMSVRPVFEGGRLWVPLASGVGAFNLYAEWVPSSNRLNVKTPL